MAASHNNSTTRSVDGPLYQTAHQRNRPHFRHFAPSVVTADHMVVLTQQTEARSELHVGAYQSLKHT